jgi:hypothetical protein
MALTRATAISARRLFILLTVFFILVMPSAIYSCGPFFEEAVFTPAEAPQVSHKNFAAGKLGIILPTLRPSYLVVAYRYLSGLTLNAQQQHDAVDVWSRRMGPNPQSPDTVAIEAWQKARAQVPGFTAAQKFDSYAPVSRDQPYQQFMNCPDASFQSAASTLAERIHKYGPESAAVRDWTYAQDQVFSNCDGTARVIPAALTSSDPLLGADRNYQIAAARFYARDFTAAAASFDALAKDLASPWATMGPYLAARALIRQATLATADYGKFDVPMMRAAQQKLEQVLNDPHSAPMHAAAQRLLDYVRFRTEPEKRVAELERLLLQPDPGLDFKQHLWDYVLLTSHGEEAESLSDDLSDWLRTFHTDSPEEILVAPHPADPAAAAHMLAKWRAHRSLPWLLVALQQTPASDSSAAELLNAASQVPPTSPGYLTVRYYALRMTIMKTGPQQVAARAELDALLSRTGTDLEPGTRNLLNDERQRLATSLPDFLAHAAEIPAAVGVPEFSNEAEDEDSNDKDIDNGKSDLNQPKPSKQLPLLNAYAAHVLAQQMPLAKLVESARSTALPNPLRREIARSTWMRAILVGDISTADQLQPLLSELDNPLWTMMAPFRSASTNGHKTNAAKKNDDSKNDGKIFAAVFLTLQNPGLQPTVREGLVRSTTLGELDNFHDNWWCDNLADSRADDGRDQNAQAHATAPPSFLSSDDDKAAQSDLAKLAEAGPAPNFLTAAVLAYAAHHPDDARVPQALYLAVRSTRYGCGDKETTNWSAKAFRLLHQQYPKSEWAEKTKYHY